MDDDLKKLTFSMDKANGESRTVIVIVTSSTVGNWTRTKFAQPITVRPDEIMRLIKEEVIENPGIVGMIPSSVILDDFSKLEQHITGQLAEIGTTQPMLVEPIWKQYRPYGKKNRRKFK